MGLIYFIPTLELQITREATLALSRGLSSFYLLSTSDGKSVSEDRLQQGARGQGFLKYSCSCWGFKDNILITSSPDPKALTICERNRNVLKLLPETKKPQTSCNNSYLILLFI